MSRDLYPELEDSVAENVGDRLARIFDRQLRFNRRVWFDKGLGVDDLSSRELATRVKDYVLHVEGELHELLRELDWKMHARAERPLERGNALEEYVDVVKYIVGLANVFGFSSGEVYAEFERKSKVVEYRYAMERRLREIPSENVVAVDLDGVLNDYPRCFVRWVVAQVPAGFEDGDADRITYQEMCAKLGPKRVAELKDDYRRSGAKREQGVREGAREMLETVRKRGRKVVVISSRPYWRFSRIFADTLDWSDLNRMPFDALLFHREKHRKILDDFPKLVAMVEDDPAIAAEVARTGMLVVMPTNEINRGIDVPGVRRVETLAEVTDLIS